MHKGIVHNDGSGQGLADEPRIGEMYVLPHAWQNILNRMLPRGVRPVRRITFENPPITGPDQVPGFAVPVRSSISRRTLNQINETKIDREVNPTEDNDPENNIVHRVRLIKYQFQKGEVYKIPHKMDELVVNNGHINNIAEHLDGQLIDMVDYEGQSKLRLPWPIWLLITIITVFFIYWLLSKGINTVEGIKFGPE